MKLFSSKKAQGEPAEETTFPIFAAVIAFVIIMLQLISMIDGLKQYTVFERGFLERDIANVMDILYASPGNIVIDYDKSTKWFSFIFDKNSVNAYEKLDVLLPDNEIYYFTPDKKTAYSTIELRPVFREETEGEKNLIESVNLRFAKTDKKLNVNKKESLFPNLNELECPDVDNPERFSDSPSKGFNDIIDIDDVREKNNALGYDVFVWYYPGDYEDTTQNTIKAFISSEVNLKENRRLACLIINLLLDKFEKIAKENNLEGVTSVAIIPTDSWQMLNQQGYLAVLLEIGNKKIPQEKNFWSNDKAKNAVLEAIDGGIKSYG